jgi:hypothetical protein
MKKIFRSIIGITVLSLSMTGCTDLDYENYSQINSENFPATERDLEAATIGVYSTLANTMIMQWLNNAGWTYSELTTDELNTGWGGTWQQLERFQWKANSMQPSTCYNNYQKGITKATRIIDAFEKSSVDESKKRKYISELRVLRALFANYLYDMVGPVPIVTDPDIANDVYTEWKPSRPSRQEYVNFMVTELQEAYKYLDIKQSSENLGRVSQGMALTLLMKIYLNDKQWQNAANTAQQIMNLGVYSLMPSYKAIFSIENEGTSNTERIFAIPRVMSNQSYAWNYFSAVLPAVPLYKCTTGAQLSISGGLKMPWEFYDKYEAQDTRLETIIRYYIDKDGNEVDLRKVRDSKATGAAPMKYSEDPDQGGQMSGNDFIVYRYADVLLSRAEALNEISGPTQEAIDLINQVRNRCNATPLSVSDYTKETLRDFLCDERGRELYCEGHRRTDLIRFGKLIEKVRAKGYSAEDYMTLFPIPQSVINENPNIAQNPGY